MCARPASCPGIASPLRNVSGPELDWVIVRENSEGEYAGVGGRAHRGLPEEVATDVSIFTRAGRHAHHALRLRAGPLAAAQAPHRRHQVECAAARHGDVGRDRGRGRGRIPRRHLGQDAGRRHDHAHDAQAAVARHHRRHQPARRHPFRSRRGAGGIARHRADRQPQPGAQISLHVRADPRLGVRHHGQGHRQPDRHVLVGRR